MLATVPHTLKLQGILRGTDLSLAFRRNVLPLFKETLHNLVKHSRATGVDISVIADGKTISISACKTTA